MATSTGVHIYNVVVVKGAGSRPLSCRWTAPMSEQAASIREAARSGDKDFFLAALFAPEDKQAHLFALQAFAAELARIPTLVSEPQIGEIRLQWWGDTLEQPEGGLGGHPIAAALMETVRTCGLPLQPLQQMIEARRFDLYADRMPDVTSLEATLR